MDSTPINDIMMEPPMMTDEPKMQGMMPQMTAPQPQGMHTQQAEKPASKNPMNLTDEQMTALLVAACTGLAGGSRAALERRPQASVPAEAAFATRRRGPLLGPVCCTGATAHLASRGSGRTGSDAIPEQAEVALVHSPARYTLELGKKQEWLAWRNTLAPSSTPSTRPGVQ